jgi:hypothetical protein
MRVPVTTKEMGEREEKNREEERRGEREEEEERRVRRRKKNKRTEPQGKVDLRQEFPKRQQLGCKYQLSL